MRDFRNESPALSAELIALRQDVQPTWHDAPWKAPTNENRDQETVVLPVNVSGNSGSVPFLLRHGNQWEGEAPAEPRTSKDAAVAEFNAEEYGSAGASPSLNSTQLASPELCGRRSVLTRKPLWILSKLCHCFPRSEQIEAIPMPQCIVQHSGLFFTAVDQQHDVASAGRRCVA